MTRRCLLGIVSLVVLGAVSSASASTAALKAPIAESPQDPVDVLIVAPHPDDDTITAAGVTMRAKEAGRSVRIVYMTNGDYPDGRIQGLQRQAEAVSASTGHLGMLEEELIFLGYPDFYLREVDLHYPGAGDQFTAPWGQAVTYGGRGLGGTDYHTYRFGSPAAYNRANILVDLEDILSSFKPKHILLPSEWDAHSDHATTYSLVSAALASVFANDPTYVPTVHKTIVWSDGINDPVVWPDPMDPTAYHSEVNDLSETDLVWAERESIDVPLAMQSPISSGNPKYLAIAAIPSQGGTGGFLGRFIHKDEFFWVENQLGANQPPRVDAGPGQTVPEGATVALDGTGSSDPDSPTLSHQWTQTAGMPVTLSDPGAPGPTFVAPTGLSQDEWLGFELTVGDGQLTSIPDLVLVKVLAAQPPRNIAPLATVSASSENAAAGQQAEKAVDGVPDGDPGDSTREWATLGEQEGAWIELDWARPYSVDRMTLHDRPNLRDRIVAGTVMLGDGSTLDVGSLDDAGGGSDTSFGPKIVTSLRLTVDSTSGTTLSVGLAELAVFRTPSPDGDGDDWTLSDGDCNDAEASTHPAAPDASCDGVDQNCSGVADEEYLPTTTSCGVGACMAAGTTSCGGGQVVDSCTPGAPASEVCDGLDNDCNGTTDDAPLPGLVAGLQVTGATLAWQPLPGATAYDVVSGNLGALSASKGDFTVATRGCLANDLAATSLTYLLSLGPGRGAFFLVRAENCGGAGSYDEPSQSGSRDTEIQASGLACP